MADDMPETVGEHPDLLYTRQERDDTSDPDVLLDIPAVQVDRIKLDVEDLRARVSLEAEVLDLLRLHVGVDAVLGRVELEIEGVEAQAMLKVRLDNVAEIISDVLSTIDRNPELIARTVGEAAGAVQDVTKAAPEAVRSATEAAPEVVRSATDAAPEAVRSATDAARDIKLPLTPETPPTPTDETPTSPEPEQTPEPEPEPATSSESSPEPRAESEPESTPAAAAAPEPASASAAEPVAEAESARPEAESRPTGSRSRGRSGRVAKAGAEIAGGLERVNLKAAFRDLRKAARLAGARQLSELAQRLRHKATERS